MYYWSIHDGGDSSVKLWFDGLEVVIGVTVDTLTEGDVGEDFGTEEHEALVFEVVAEGGEVVVVEAHEADGEVDVGVDEVGEQEEG